MSIRTWTVAASTFELGQVLLDAEFRDLNGKVWVQGQTGNHWTMQLTFRNVTGANRRQIWADIGEARGKRNQIRVDLSTVCAYTRGGVGTGTPLVDGANTAGSTTIDIRNLTGDTTGWSAAGDLISINDGTFDYLHILTSDLDITTGTGTAEIWPELLVDFADADTISYTQPRFNGIVEGAAGFGSGPFPSDWLSTITLDLRQYF